MFSGSWSWMVLATVLGIIGISSRSSRYGIGRKRKTEKWRQARQTRRDLMSEQARQNRKSARQGKDKGSDSA